jgi:hypothetical protein
MIRPVWREARRDDRRDAAVFAIAENDTTSEQMRHGVAGNDDIVAVARLAVTGDEDAAPVGADNDLGVDAAAVSLADGRDRLIVHRDQGAVDHPGPRW